MLSIILVWMMFAHLAVSTTSGSSSPDPMSIMNMPHGQAMPASAGGPASAMTASQWSVFNHHGAGWFIIVWGLTALVAGLQWPARTWLRFAPPVVLLGLTEFLYLPHASNDWPIGPTGFWAGFQDPSVFQHRIFLLILLLIVIVELLRAADRLPPLLRKFALPGLAVLASSLLLIHKHAGPEMQQMLQHMSDPTMAASPAMKAMLASMESIKRQHTWFAFFGLGLAATKLSADMGLLKSRLGATLWTFFAIALGIYMTGYTE